MSAYNKDLIDFQTDVSTDSPDISSRRFSYIAQYNDRFDGRLDFASGWVEKYHNKEEWQTRYCF